MIVKIAVFYTYVLKMETAENNPQLDNTPSANNLLRSMLRPFRNGICSIRIRVGITKP